MIKKADIPIVVFIVLVLYAVNLRADIVPLTPNSDFIVQDGIEYYIQTDKAVYNLGENVEILYRITNVSTDPIDIGMVLHGSGVWVDFFITADDNTDIWQLLRIPPPSGWEMLHLEPAESKEREITWDMISDNGTFLDHDDDYLVSPGFYNITGELTLSNAYSYKKVPISVSIEIIPEPATILFLALGSLFLTNLRQYRRTKYD